jgi:hypothetical protein
MLLLARNFHVTVVDSQRNFSKKPVTQLAVSEKHNMLVSLSGIPLARLPLVWHWTLMCAF